MQLQMIFHMVRTKGATLFSKSAISDLQPIFAKPAVSLDALLICDFMAPATWLTLEDLLLVSTSTFLLPPLLQVRSHMQIIVRTMNQSQIRTVETRECHHFFGMVSSLDRMQNAGWGHIRSLAALRP
jgi:hypothetical protein